jgi:hypothetical protein
VPRQAHGYGMIPLSRIRPFLPQNRPSILRV